MPTRSVASMGIDLGTRQFAGRDFPIRDVAVMDDMLSIIKPCIFDHEDAAGGADPSGIADLAATLGVKGRRLQDDSRLIALGVEVEDSGVFLGGRPRQKLGR